MEQKFNSVLEVKRPTSAFLNARDPRQQLKNSSDLQVGMPGHRTVTAGSKFQSLRVQQMLDANLTEKHQDQVNELNLPRKLDTLQVKDGQ